MIHRSPSEPQRLPRWLAWGIVLVGVVLLAVLSQRVERTPDELNYLLSGRTLVQRQPLVAQEQRYQGPLILLGTQLSDDGGPAYSDPATIQRARLGMLVFPALLLAVLVHWSRSALGERAAVLTAWLAVTNPTLLAYGPLLSSDVALTALGVTASFALWRWLRSARLRDLLLVGVAFGSLAATKYTALLLCVALSGVALGAAVFGFDALPPRFRRAAPKRLGRVVRTGLALVVVAAIALPTLYAWYLFASPPFPTAAASSLQSGLLRFLAGLPLGTQLLGLLPEPMVFGIDFQSVIVAQQANGTFFDQVGNHWAYYPVSLLTKTPIATTVLAVVGIGLLLRRQSAARLFLACALVPAAGLLVYCSATRPLQMGVRYVLPMVPALLLLAGACAEARWAATVFGRALATLVLLGSLLIVSRGWPYYIGWFNSAVGGSAGGYRVCYDGNCDWAQRIVPGLEAIRLRHPGVTLVRQGEGPRFGLVCANTAVLHDRDREDTQRIYHWLSRFSPIDNDYAAWLVFDVTPEAFARCRTAGDARTAHDLAVAWLRAGDFAAARRALAGAGATGPRDEARGQVLAGLIEVLEAVASGSESMRAAAVDACERAGHADLALSVWTSPGRQDAVRVFLLMVGCGRAVEAVERLERVTGDGSRTAMEAFLLATASYEGGMDLSPDPVRARQLLTAGPVPEPGSPLQPMWDELQKKVQRAMAWIDATATDR